jgi:hypothetical protein
MKGFWMSTAARSTVPDIADLRETAAAVRAVAKRSSGDGEADASLEAVAAEMEITAEKSAAQDGSAARGRARHMRYLELKARQLRWMAWTGDTRRASELLKLAKELEDRADRLKGQARAFAGGGGLLAREAPWVRFAPVAVATIIGLAAVILSGDRWLPSRADSWTGATETALDPPVPPPADPAPPTAVAALPPSISIAPPPQQPMVAVLATRLAAEIVASERRVAKLEPAGEPKPRRVARAAAPADAPPAVRQPDLSRGGRDDAARAPLPPTVDAAAAPPPDQPPSAPDARQAALPPSTATGSPVPLVARAPAAALGEAAEPAPAAGTSAPSPHECTPYSSDTTMSGRSEPVRGLACRDADGTWRRMSEVPRPNRGP